MCGIYGYTSIKERVQPDILRRMGKTLAHRGPDDGGEIIQDKPELSIGLGHKRLSIIDLSPAGRQPMSNEDGTIWITLNGEIYNFKELRTELKHKGHRFRSHSDSEVVIHLYEELGRSCLARLEGMFAFALWDSTKRTLFLARDRFGKKPLHYAVIDGGIVFASEIKALLVHPQVSREIDLQSMHKYLTYEYVPAPASIFRSIKKLEPAHYLVHRGGQVQSAKYWDIPLLEYPVTDKTETECEEELVELLDQSVRTRLVSDVPVGIYLSGGIDSGLVAALAARAAPQLECFTIGFDEPSFDERQHAAQIARHVGLKHHVQVFHPRDMLRLIPELPSIFDEPLADPSALPLYLLSQFASGKVKVVLSGDGGDELFAGYQTYQAHRLVTYFDILPAFIKSALRFTASRMAVSHNYLSLDFKIKQFLKGVGISSEIRFFLWRGAFSNMEMKELLTPEVQAELRHHNAYEDIFRYIADSRLTKELERILYLGIKLYLQDNNLVTADRASMANGLEVRSPLLDSKFAEFACGLPMDYKFRKMTTKYLLKKAAEKHLPAEIVHRQKRGFGIPLAKWLTGELKPLMLDYFSEEKIRAQKLFNYGYIERLVEEQMTRKKDNREFLWTLLVFQLWYETYIERAGGGCRE
jgi:asparagine synthase (glutamine-hydrolysing)